MLKLTRMKKIVKFLKEVQAELKKVHWPTRAETIKFTTIVIFITFVVAIYIGSLDYIFAKIIGILIQ